jgi:hypothetical protein
MKRLILCILISALLFIPSIVIIADPGDPGPGPGTPLDGGLLTILIGSGIVYLGNKYRKNKKNKE